MIHATRFMADNATKSVDQNRGRLPIYFFARRKRDGILPSAESGTHGLAKIGEPE
jgi:hypothetical protein